MNIPLAICNGCPASSLNRARRFEREFVKVLLPLIFWNDTLSHQPPQIAIRGYIVKPVVVYANMRHMRRHALHRALAPNLQQVFLSRNFISQNRASKLKSLRPLGPSARGVFAIYGKDWRALLRIPCGIDTANFLCRQLKKTIQPDF